MIAIISIILWVISIITSIYILTRIKKMFLFFSLLLVTMMLFGLQFYLKNETSMRLTNSDLYYVMEDVSTTLFLNFALFLCCFGIVKLNPKHIGYTSLFVVCIPLLFFFTPRKLGEQLTLFIVTAVIVLIVSFYSLGKNGLGKSDPKGKTGE